MCRSLLALALGTHIALAAACATTGHTRAQRTPALDSRIEKARMSRRLYALAELEQRAGRSANAINLFRQVVFLLPDDPSADPLRHRLIMRMLAIALVSGHQQGDAGQLIWGRTLIARYRNKHLRLLDGPLAAGERSEISAYAEAFDHALLALAPSRAPERAEDEKTRSDQGLHDDDDASFVDDEPGEEIIVHTKPFARAYDPSVLAYQNHASPLGPSLLLSGDAPAHPTRTIVRFGPLRRATKAEASLPTPGLRRHVRSRLRAHRPQINACFVEGLMRHPQLFAFLHLRLAVNDSGQFVGGSVTQGQLLDKTGNDCVLASLGLKSSAPKSSSSARRFYDLRLSFLVQAETPFGPARAVTGQGTGRVPTALEADLFDDYDIQDTLSDQSIEWRPTSR